MERIASAHEIELYNVPPRKWQGALDVPDNLQGRERKKWLKEHAEGLFPNINVTNFCHTPLYIFKVIVTTKIYIQIL